MESTIRTVDFSSAGLSRSFKIMFAVSITARSLHRRHIRTVIELS